MRLFRRARPSGPALEPRLAAFRAEQGGGHDLALLERRTEAALAESGLEWEGEQLPGDRTWQIATDAGPVWIFSSVRDDAVSLNQTVLGSAELSLDDAFVRGLLRSNAHTEGPYAALAQASAEDPYYLLLRSNIPLEALAGERLRSALEAFLLRRRLLESGEQPERGRSGSLTGEQALEAAAACVEELAASLELALEPQRDDPHAWRLKSDGFDVHVELDLLEDVLRAWVPVEAADGVRSELRLFSYFLERGGLFNSSFSAIIPYRSESWVAAMSTVSIGSVTPATIAFALEHPLHSARDWRD
jgi:hypothetical protein